VAEDRLLADRARIALASFAEKLGVAAQVAAVRGQRAGGETALDGQPRVVLNEEPVQQLVRRRVGGADGPGHVPMMATAGSSAAAPVELPTQIAPREQEPDDALGDDDAPAGDEGVHLVDVDPFRG